MRNCCVRLTVMPAASSVLFSARHVAAQAPDEFEGRSAIPGRETFQQAALAAPHHDVERFEQGAAFVGQEYFDIAAVAVPQYTPHVALRLHVHQRAAERGLL